MGILRKTIGQEAADRMLTSALESGRLAHAYLFAGPVGVGRLTTALELAASWMCSAEGTGYCGTCRDCTRVFGFSHPDVRLTVPEIGSTTPDDLARLFETRLSDGVSPLLFPGNSSISIGQVRGMEKRLSMRAFENRGHIEIFTAAHRMRTEAANALLKTLEEPPDDTVMILISSSWTALLPTVRSRSHLVRFRRVPPASIAELLAERTDLDREEAMRIALSSDGSPGRALLAAAGETSAMPEESPGEVLRQVVAAGSPSEVMGIAVSQARKLRREGTMQLVTGLKSCVHDLRRVSIGLPSLMNLPEQLAGLDLSDDAAEEGLAIFNTAADRLKGNGMARVVLTAALLGFWKSVASGSGPGKGSSIEA